MLKEDKELFYFTEGGETEVDENIFDDQTSIL